MVETRSEREGSKLPANGTAVAWCPPMYHPPVMVVAGARLCQGHDVPTTEEVVDAIEAAAGQA